MYPISCMPAPAQGIISKWGLISLKKLKYHHQLLIVLHANAFQMSGIHTQQLALPYNYPWIPNLRERDQGLGTLQSRTASAWPGWN